MGIVFRQSIKTSIVTLTGAVLGAFITFLYTYVLTKAEVGLVTNILFTGAIVQYMVMLGFSSTIAIFTQKYDEQDERRKTLFTLGIIVTLSAAAIFTVLFMMLKDPIINLYDVEDQPLLRKYYFLVPLLVVFWSMVSIFDNYLVAHVKIAISAFAREALLRMLNIALLGLLFLKIITVNQFIIGTVLVYLIPLAMLIVVASRTKGFGFSTNFSVFSKKEYRDIIHFSWYHVLMIVSMNILNYMDTLLLGPLDNNGIESAAVYSRAVLIAGMMMMPFRAMATSSLPILNDAYINGDNDKIKDLFSRAGINILIAGVGMFVLMGVNLDNAVAILPEGYEAVKPLVLILMLGKLIDMATGLNNELISISKYYKFNFWVSCLLVVMVYTLDRIYIPQYGTFGAAWVATASLATFNILKMIFLYAKMKLHPFTNGSLLVLVAGAIAAIAGYLLPYMWNPFVDAVIRSAVVMIVYLAMLLWLKPSHDLLTYISNIREHKRLF